MAKFTLNIDVTSTVQIPVEAKTIEEAIKKGYTDENVQRYLKENGNIADTYLTHVLDGKTDEILEEYK